jgi:hypothetical protein
MANVDPIKDWGDDIRKYNEGRRSHFTSIEPNVRIKQKDFKALEASYNPIIQKYANKDKELQAQENEKNKMIDILAKNKVTNSTQISKPNPKLPFRIPHYDMNRHSM